MQTVRAQTSPKTRKCPRKRHKVCIFPQSVCEGHIYTDHKKDDSDSSSDSGSDTSSDEESEEEEKPKVSTKKSKKVDAMDIDEQEPKDLKKRKRAETTEAPVEKSEKKSKKSKKETEPASEQAGGGEQWNVQALDGGAQRQAKFLKLLGGGKKGDDAANADSGATKSRAEIAKMTSNLEKQFNQGMQAKEAGVSRRRGLGA